MNIYLINGHDHTNYGFPQNIDVHLLSSVLLKECHNYELFDIDKDTLQENSIIFLTCDEMLDRYRYKCEHNIIDISILQIKQIKNKKIIINDSTKYLSNNNQLPRLKEILHFLDFQDENIYYIVQLKSNIDTVKKELSSDINVWYKDRWLNEFAIYFISRYEDKLYELPKKQKFSVFVRRYDHTTNLRFHLFCELLNKKLLEHFYYTFCGEIKNEQGTLSIENGKNFCKEYVYKLPDTYNRFEILDWIENLPYSSNKLTSGYDDFFTISLVPFYQNSYINLVVESHQIHRKYHSDNSLITEKTYKAIFHKKPFLVFSHPHTLKILRDCGYKTFDGIFDESYDKIEDVYERLTMIVNEIERLNKLPAHDFQDLLCKCQDIVEHNHKLLIEEINKPTPDKFLIKNMKFL
jgi:hypothetical protein